MSATIDIDKLFSDIHSAAEEYQLCCGIFVQQEETAISGKCGDFDLDRDFVIDSSGGFLLGLSAMKLICDGRLSPRDPVLQFIPECKSFFSPEITVGHLLSRRSGLPDPLREVLLPEIHSSLEAADADGFQMLCHEHTAILQHRSFEKQLQLIKDEDGLAVSNLAPSLLEEATLLEIIEEVTGTPITDFQRQHILAPLGIDARCGVYDNGTGWLAYAESTAIEYIADTETAGVFTLSFSELVRLADAMSKGYPMTEDCRKELLSCKLSGQTLPYGRRQGVLRAHSSVCGRHTEIFIDSENNLVVLIASRTPMLAHPDSSGGYRRFDTDIISYINSQRVLPAHTRMERLSHRNIPSALAISLEPEQQNYVAAPAVVIAESAAQRHPEMAAQVGGRQSFVISDSGITIGILSVMYEPSLELARLDALIIDRMYQRRGFGRIAVKWAIKHTRREGFSRLMVCVDRRNSTARALYESEGFRLCAVHDSAFVLEYLL